MPTCVKLAVLTLCILPFVLATQSPTLPSCARLAQRAALRGAKKCADALKALDNTACLGMLDASAGIPPGILEGGIRSYGSFDECKRDQSHGLVYAVFSLNLTAITKPLGIPAVDKMVNATSEFQVAPQVGLCIPPPCAQEGAKLLGDKLISTTIVPFGHEISTGAALTVALIVLLVVLSFLGSFLTMKGIPGLVETRLSSPVIEAFSVVENFYSLCDTKIRFAATSSLEGMRVLSMQWVVIGHTLMLLRMSADNVLTVQSDVMTRWTMVPIENGTFSVDTFFTISGFLLSFVILRKLEAKRSKDGVTTLFGYVKQMLMLCLHRWLRLAPSLGLVMLVHAQLVPDLNDGPFWGAGMQLLSKSCKDYWWTNLLFINNFYPKNLNNECVGQSWYLANDFQFFVFFLPILFLFVFWEPMRSRRWLCYTLVCTVIAGSILVRISYALEWDLSFSGGAAGPRNPKDPHGNKAGYLYIQPHSRVGAYAVGVLAGLFLHHFNRDLKGKADAALMSDIENEYKSVAVVDGQDLDGMEDGARKRTVKCLCTAWTMRWWAVLLGCLGIMTCILMSYYRVYHSGYVFSKTENVFYVGFTRVAWAVAVAGVMLGCATDALPLVNRMLSLPIFVPLSKLSYGVYVLHITVLVILLDGLRATVHYTDQYAIFIYLGVLAVSYLLAAWLYVLVDLPVAKLEARYLR